MEVINDLSQQKERRNNIAVFSGLKGKAIKAGKH